MEVEIKDESTNQMIGIGHHILAPFGSGSSL